MTLTTSQLRALQAMEAAELRAKKTPTVKYGPKPDDYITISPRARASKKSSWERPHNITVNALAARKLEEMGLARQAYVPRYGSDAQGHWGGADSYYSLTDAGRTALTETRK